MDAFWIVWGTGTKKDCVTMPVRPAKMWQTKADGIYQPIQQFG
jgi:hypothetical protein